MTRVLEKQYRPICGLHAIALSTPDKTVQDVEAFFRPKRGARWQGRLYWHEILRGLEYFGVEHKEIKLEIGKRSATRLHEQLEPDKQYLVFVTDHFFTYKGGHIWDQHYNEGVPLKESRWARKRVRHVALIKRS